MKYYLSSSLKPGTFSDYDPEKHRVDPDGEPTLRDRLARLVSNAYSDKPGRMCMIKRDYCAADDILAFLRREGIWQADCPSPSE